MPGALYNRLADLAAENYGYLTTEEVEKAGIDPHRLLELARRGQLERRARGLYRLALIPPTPLDPYREATLWPRGSEGVISHATALDLYGLGDVNPEKIHLTLPRAHRPRREVPGQYVLHHEDLAPGEVRLHEGIPVVTPAKAIRQSGKLGPELLRGALEDGLRRGLLRPGEAEDLRAELGLG
ncbi:MAG: type IV toxin-antitoxin system AbiEi family antitoxin domain-containing protein [Solirubrobacterales bacterium]